MDFLKITKDRMPLPRARSSNETIADEQSFRSKILDNLDSNNNSMKATDRASFSLGLNLEAGDSDNRYHQPLGLFTNGRSFVGDEEDLNLGSSKIPVKRKVDVLPGTIKITLSDDTESLENKRSVTCKEGLRITVNPSTTPDRQIVTPRSDSNPRLKRRAMLEARSDASPSPPVPKPKTPVFDEKIRTPVDITDQLDKASKPVEPVSVKPRIEDGAKPGPFKSRVEASSVPGPFKPRVDDSAIPSPFKSVAERKAIPGSPKDSTKTTPFKSPVEASAKVPVMEKICKTMTDLVVESDECWDRPKPEDAGAPSATGCICERKSRMVFCESCGFRIKSRVKKSCPLHLGMVYLMDLEVCPKCLSRRLSEL